MKTTIWDVFVEAYIKSAKPHACLLQDGPTKSALEAVAAHILANDPTVVKMREALIKAQEQCQFIISHTQGHEFANGVARESWLQIDAALQNKTEGL